MHLNGFDCSYTVPTSNEIQYYNYAVLKVDVTGVMFLS